MYSATVLQHFQSPYHLGPMPEANAVGQVGAPGEGPYLRLYLRIADDCITAASFETYSCPAAIASASFVVQWVEGKRIAQASVLDAGDLMQILGGLPLGKEHCALRSVQALQLALSEYAVETQREEG